MPPTIDNAYKQYHVVVAVDSKQEDAHAKNIKPTRTRGSDGAEKRALTTRVINLIGGSVGVTPGPHTVGGITFTAQKTTEKGEVIEKTRYDSAIVDHDRDGIVWWSFNVDDDNYRKWGMDMEDTLPSVSFEFVGHEPPPRSMDIMITSHWSIIPSQWKDGSSWIAKLFHRFKSSGDTRPSHFKPFGDTETPPYLNLFQVVALITDPPHLPERFHYKAKMEVSSGASGDPTFLKTPPESLNVIPKVVDSRLPF